MHRFGDSIQRFWYAIAFRLTTVARKSRRALFYIRPLIRHPGKIYKTSLQLKNAWRIEGLDGVKAILRRLPDDIMYNDIWINQYLKSFTGDVLRLMQRRIESMENPPLISVLLRTYDAPERILRRTIASVLGQMYRHWELCIVDDGSTQPHVRHLLNEMAAGDNRIKVARSPRNASAAVATNQALKMASGTYVAMLNQTDLLEPQALFRIADCILADAPDMIYSDEAELSEDGGQINNSTHRPAFSLEYLRSCPYILHLAVFRKELLRQFDGWDECLPNSHEYDLVLKFAEQADRIAHIPEILYLCRKGQAPDTPLDKAEIMQVHRQILTLHLARCGEVGLVHSGQHYGYSEVRYPIQSGLKVAIIIPTKNHGELVRQCVESIERTVKIIPYEIFIVDHASDEASSLEYFDQIRSKHKVLRYDGSFNFSAINNFAVSKIRGQYSHYLFCNNDIEATQEGWLERMMELGQMQDVGIVGAKLLYPDRKTIQHAGVCVGMYGIAEHYGKFMSNVRPDGSLHSGYHGSLIANHEMSAVTAACALMSRDVFESVGGFEDELSVGFGDVDLCLKTRELGYRILFCAQAVLIHHESYTRGKSREDPHPKDSAYFVKKWRTLLNSCDPYYNPNLTLQNTRWEVKQPALFNLDISNRIWARASKAGWRSSGHGLQQHQESVRSIEQTGSKLAA